jgi:Fibronectin type III domain
MLSSHTPYASNGNNSVRRCWGALLLLATAGLLAACGSAESTNRGVTSASLSGNKAGLAWDPVIAANLAGYRVYYGTAPSAYLQPLGQGLNAGTTTYTVTGLQAGTYYFAVTSYDMSNIESGFSNEVSKSIP